MEAKKGYLKSDIKIDGIHCKKGWIWFHKNDHLKEVKLAKSYKYHDIVIPKDTWIRFDSTGAITLCFFPKDIMINGYLCKGSKMQREGVMTTFYPKGKLKSFFPTKDILVDNILCKKSILQGITLYPNGKLKKCKLAKETEIDNKLYKKGEIVQFDIDGKVME